MVPYVTGMIEAIKGEFPPIGPVVNNSLILPPNQVKTWHLSQAHSSTSLFSPFFPVSSDFPFFSIFPWLEASLQSKIINNKTKHNCVQVDLYPGKNCPWLCLPFPFLPYPFPRERSTSFPPKSFPLLTSSLICSDMSPLGLLSNKDTCDCLDVTASGFFPGLFRLGTFNASLLETLSSPASPGKYRWNGSEWKISRSRRNL